MTPVAVAIVEDHPEFRDALCQALRSSEAFEVLEICKDLPAGLALVENACPDVLLVDLGLPSGSGLTLIHEARRCWGKRCTSAVLTVTGNEEHLLAAIGAGAKGYLFKSDQPADWVGTVRLLASGASPLHANLARSFLQRLQAQRLLQWVFALFVLPLALFVGVVMLLGRPHPQVLPVQTAPDFSQAQWQPIAFPKVIELPASSDLPPDAPKTRAWFRVRVPPELLGANRPPGCLGLMDNRVIGGPWAVWANGRLVQANLNDWRIQWNTPMRVMLPLDVTEVLVAVPYAQVQGYAVGVNVHRSG